MSKLCSSKLFTLTRRFCSTAVENARMPAAMAVERVEGKAAAAGAVKAAKEEVFWMRDPKTGYWIPENRFADVDVAELRAQLLPRRS